MSTQRRPVTALLWLVFIMILAGFAPVLTSATPYQPYARPLASPMEHPPFGTDALGRDQWTRMIYGSRISPGASLVALSITAVIGGIAGLSAAMTGGVVDRLLMGVANSALAVPGLLFALLLVAGRGPGLFTIVLAVGISGIPGFARLSRTIFIQLRNMPYVQAAHAIGANSLRIAVYHVLPNALSQLLPLATTQYAWSFLGTTTLTFLGMAGDPTLPEWGAMLNAGRIYLLEAPWLVLIPGLAITLTILAVHAMGEWLATL